MNNIYLINFISVGVFGMILSAAFCDIIWTRKKILMIAGSMSAILMFQGIIYFWFSQDLTEYIYPLITHIPLTMLLCVLSKKPLWSVISVLTAYLCCQLRRWLALLIVTVFSGDSMMQNIAELVMTLPILLVLLRLTAPAVRSISRAPFSLQCQFGLVPALYYGFDYLTRIYTELLLDGILVAVEFMPFVCSVAYLIFALYASKEKGIRNKLEQTQDILNLQVMQAVREIEVLRGSQQKNRVYRHDLRHHLQYISSCIENGRLGQAQDYIGKICSEIETSRVMSFCENESVNLIFSNFDARAKEQGISIDIKSGISSNIPVSETDLCVLLSNALENALHACQKQIEKGLSGAIEVSAYERKGKIFLQIINSCDKDVAFRHGLPVACNPGHGIGVRSICAIVKRYNGIYAFSCKEDKFILRVSI